LLDELCSRTCSQDGEEQRWLYEDAGVGGMSFVYAAFCSGLPWGTAFSMTIQAAFKSKVLGLAQRYVTPVSAQVGETLVLSPLSWWVKSLWQKRWCIEMLCDGTL